MRSLFLVHRRSPVEVINNLSGGVAASYRVLQPHYPYFIDTLRSQVTSRGEFRRLMAEQRATLTDLDRAARFLYLVMVEQLLREADAPLQRA